VVVLLGSSVVSRTLSGFMGRSLCLLGVVLLTALEVKQDLGIVLLLPTGGVVVALKGEAGEWLETGSRAILPPAGFEGLGADFTLKGTP